MKKFLGHICGICLFFFLGGFAYGQSTTGSPSMKLGEYSGSFKNTNSNRSSMGMGLVITKVSGEQVSGHIVLYVGFCSGEKRSFSGILKDGRLTGKTHGPERCTPDLTVDATVSDSKISGSMVGSNPYEIFLSN